MSFEPLPSVAKYHIRASSAAGLFAVLVERVVTSMAAAPASIRSMSSPWIAAGKSPTAASSEVRPPTQSHMGRKSSQLFSFE